MLPLFFWKDWSRPSKYLFYLLASALLVFIVLMLFFQKEGYDFPIDWQVITFKTPVPVVIEEISIGAFSFPLVIENFVVEEFYQGSPMKVNVFVAYLFLAFTILAMCISLAISSMFERLWYLIFATISVLVLVFFRFQELSVFGLGDNTFLIVIIVSYLGLSYYFHAIKVGFAFIQRLAAFIGLSILFSLVIYQFSEVENPFLLLTANGFLLPYILGLIFCLAVAHEVFHGLVFVLTRSSSNGNMLVHFLVFSLIYLGSLTILYLHDTFIIDWTFIFINPYVLISISTLVGLWGLGSRLSLFGEKYRETQYIVFLYLAIGILFFSSTAYFLGNGNDVILQIVKDVVIYGHLGIGFMFFLYVLVNFSGMLSNGMEVHKVIYSPNNMPHFTFRIAGLIVVLALFLKASINVPLNFSLAGAFNNKGDYFFYSGDLSNAKNYYLNGKYYGYKNHKSNYQLGQIARLENNGEDAVEHYTDALGVRPSKYAYANLADVNRADGNFLEGLFNLNDGLKKFESSGELWNNKGFMFDKTPLSDSTFYALNNAIYLEDEEGISSSNLTKWIFDENIQVDVDSLEFDLELSSKGTQSNLLALRNRLNQKYSEQLNLNNPVLDIYSSSFLSNYLINKRHSFDSTDHVFVESVFDTAQNGNYIQQVGLSYATYLHYNGFTGSAIKTLNRLGAIDALNVARYQYTIALWLTEMGRPMEAIEYFELAARNGYEIDIPYALAETEAGLYNENTWSTFKVDSLEESDRGIVLAMRDIVQPRTYEALQEISDDGFMYEYLRIHKPELDLPQMKVSLNQMTNRQLAIRSSFETIDWFIRRHKLNQARELIQVARSLGASELDISIRETRIAVIESSLSKEMLVKVENHMNHLERSFFYALLSNDLAVIDNVAKANPFLEEAVIQSAKNHQDDDEELAAYNILVEALEMNKYSPVLLKEYILESLRVGLTSYAEDALYRLREVENPQDFIIFRNSYEKILEEMEESLEEPATTT